MHRGGAFSRPRPRLQALTRAPLRQYLVPDADCRRQTGRVAQRRLRSVAASRDPKLRSVDGRRRGALPAHRPASYRERRDPRLPRARGLHVAQRGQIAVELLFSQFLNGLAYGMLLFILAAGLSLIFGLMIFAMLIDGSFFLLGGFIGFSIQQASGSFWLALTPLPAAVLGRVVELMFKRGLYSRGHLDQMLMTFSPLVIS